MTACSTILLALSSVAAATTDLAIEGTGLNSSFFHAASGETLSGTSRGRITVIADEGSWNFLLVDVALREPTDPVEQAEAAEILGNHPWLTPQKSTIGAAIGQSLSGLVDAQDLAAASATPLWIDPEWTMAYLSACLSGDPQAIRDLGQAVLAGESTLVWRTSYESWANSPVSEYWLSTFAESGSLAPSQYDWVDWTRLMESAALTQIGSATAWRQFARSGQIYDAAQFGLELHMQAVSVQANPPPPATTSALTNPGLAGATPQDKPRFKVSQPITIAIAYIPPFIPTNMIPYQPGVLDRTMKTGTMIAAIGRITSATHAVFPGGGSGVITPLLRVPDAEGPFALFDIPVGAKAGLVYFKDLIDLDESEAIPIEPFEWVPSSDPDAIGDK